MVGLELKGEKRIGEKTKFDFGSVGRIASLLCPFFVSL